MDSSISALGSGPQPHNSRSSPKISWNDLAETLSRGGRDWIYIPNCGNAGDSLIAEATYQFFERFGLSYTLGDLKDTVAPGSAVIVGGGGNLIPMYPNIRNFLERSLDAIESLVVLPHTIRGHGDLLGRMDGRCTLICRDKPSYDFCIANAPRANVLLGDDMATQWEWERTRAALRDESARTTERQFLSRNLKHLTRRMLHRWKIRNGTLEAFRGDIEAKNRQHSIYNVDLSQIFSTDKETRIYAAAAVNSMAKFIDQADEVRTDRLHVGILAATLGKKVTMYDNSYGKNRSVYENSLAGRFPNLRFAD